MYRILLPTKLFLDTIKLEKNSLAFTFCGIPVVYKKSGKPTIKIYYKNKGVQIFNGLSLDKNTSQLVFDGKSEITRMEVEVVI